MPINRQFGERHGRWIWARKVLGGCMRVLRSKLLPGMVLETEAMDHDGRMLMGADTELNDRLITVLENARIPIAYITDSSFEEFNTYKEAEPLSKKEERQIRDRFRHVDLEGEFAKTLLEEVMHIARERNEAAAEAS